MKDTECNKQRAYWGARRRFDMRLIGVMPDRWWTDVRKAVVDILVRSCSGDGRCSISLYEISNKAFTTRGNVSKIIQALEDNRVIQVTRQRFKGKYKSE